MDFNWNIARIIIKFRNVSLVKAEQFVKSNMNGFSCKVYFFQLSTSYKRLSKGEQTVIIFLDMRRNI